MAPLKNSTLPLATDGVTVAVSVTLWPTTDGFGVLASVVVLVPWIVNCASLASVATFAFTSATVARTSALAVGVFGIVHEKLPEFARPLATGNQLPPLFAEYSSVTPFAATPSASLAVHVIAWTEPATQVSPPFGDVTATVGTERSTVTDAVVPMADASVTLSQSRSVTELMVTVPVPPVRVLPTPIVNSVPVVALEPQGNASVAPSIVKRPPP